MGDVRVDRLARVVVERMLELRRGQLLLIDAPTLAAPLVERVRARAHNAGAEVLTRAGINGLDRTLLGASSTEALLREDDLLVHALETVDATLRIAGEWNTHDLADVRQASTAAALRARAPARAVRLRRAQQGTLRWAVTIWPCAAHARQAGMSLEAYTDLVFAAARVDDEDAVRAWAEQAARQEALRGLLERGRTLRFLAAGTDLTLSVAGRRWRSSAANRNLPDGEVFSGPVEDSAEGTVRFSYPLVRAGRSIEDIRLRFAAGRVVEAEATRGGEALRELLAVDAGARRLGEVGIGTNFGIDRFTGQILLDEKIGGTFHLALGHGYPETGSTNVSAEHWDLICDLRAGGEILLDGTQVQRDGRFLPGTGL